MLSRKHAPKRQSLLTILSLWEALESSKKSWGVQRKPGADLPEESVALALETASLVSYTRFSTRDVSLGSMKEQQ